jgi:hypothetical protein
MVKCKLGSSEGLEVAFIAHLNNVFPRNGWGVYLHSGGGGGGGT